MFVPMTGEVTWAAAAPGRWAQAFTAARTMERVSYAQ